jgi:hypothetical protein
MATPREKERSKTRPERRPLLVRRHVAQIALLGLIANRTTTVAYSGRLQSFDRNEPDFSRQCRPRPLPELGLVLDPVRWRRGGREPRNSASSRRKLCWRFFATGSASGSRVGNQSLTPLSYCHAVSAQRRHPRQNLLARNCF